MRRTTVKIPDELDARLRNEAKRRGATISEVTREALEAHLGAGSKKPRRRRLLGTGSFNSGDGTLSVTVEERIAEILATEAEQSRS